MRRSCSVFFLALLLVLSGLAQVGSAGATDTAANGPRCQYCGMTKSKFAHTWMVVEYKEGAKTEVCSIHCAVIDLALNMDKTPKTIMVGDYSTKKSIDAEKAYWVIDGNKTGVMTTRAKWAFENKSDADAFIKEFGGAPASFDDAVKAAFEDMYQDTLMIRKKRSMMRMRQNK